MNEDFYSNKELYEKFTDKIDDLDSEISELKGELKSTRKVVKKYNNLREQIGEVHERLLGIENRTEAKSDIGQAVKDWGGWIIAILTLIIYIIEVL